MIKHRAMYELTSYLDDGTLRISLGMWCLMLYLSRHVLFIVLGGLSSFIGKKRGLAEVDFSVLFSHELLLLASVPALIVVAAAFRRIPSAGPLPRLIWRFGPALLITAVVLDLVLLWVVLPRQLHSISNVQVGFVIADVYVLVYLLRATRVHDTFVDFPEAGSES